MARHRKVAVAIWNDQKFRELSDDGKLLFLFLLTHPQQTSLGAMRTTMGGLAEERGWLPERLSAAFGEAFHRGMAKYDKNACCLWLPNFLKYNGPESPNVVKAWVGALDLIPECGLKVQAVQRAKAILEGYDKAYMEAFRKAFPEALQKAFPGFSPPEQEQEPELRDKNPQPPFRGLNGASAPLERRPRMIRDQSRRAWLALLPIVDEVKSSSELTWAEVLKRTDDRTMHLVAERVGYRLIGERTQFTTGDLMRRFRELYEQLLAQNPPLREAAS